MPALLTVVLAAAVALQEAPPPQDEAASGTRTWRARVKEITPEGKERAMVVLRASDPTDLFQGECTDLTFDVSYRRLKVGPDDRPGPTREEHRKGLQVLQDGFTTDRVVELGIFRARNPPSPAPSACELGVDALAPLDLGPDRLGVSAYTR